MVHNRVKEIYMKEMFCDKDGKLSAKRISGVVCILIGATCAVLKLGDTELVKALIYSGFVALGVTAFEKKA